MTAAFPVDMWSLGMLAFEIFEGLALAFFCILYPLTCSLGPCGMSACCIDTCLMSCN